MEQTHTVVKTAAAPSPITERDADDNRRWDIKGYQRSDIKGDRRSDIEDDRRSVTSRVTERKCCTESKMAFHTKSRKQCAGWSLSQVFPPNLDLDFLSLTFLKNIVFLYLRSNQVQANF